MRVKKPEFIISIILLVITAFMLYQTSILASPDVPNELGPKFFPYICLSVMAILSIILLLSSFNTKGEKQEKKAEISMKEAMYFFALILASVILIYIFGFSIGMAIGVTIILRGIGWRFIKAAVFSVISVAVTVLLFQTLLVIPLYKGLLF